MGLGSECDCERAVKSAMQTDCTSDNVISVAAAMLLSEAEGRTKSTATNAMEDKKRKRSKEEEAKTSLGSRFSSCPLCSASIPKARLQNHIQSCNGVEEESPARKVSPPPPLPSYSPPKNDLWSTMIANSKRIDSMMSVSQPVSGLFIVENFLTDNEERSLINNMLVETTPPFKVGNFNGTHYGKRWGVHCNLRDRKVGAAENPLPSYITSLMKPKLSALGHPKLFSFTMNEANAIEYRRAEGHNLDHHVDDRILSKEAICNLSLNGECYMTYTRVQETTVKGLGGGKEKGVLGEKVKVLLKPRTLQILTGEARYNFSHGIEHEDLLSPSRISLTMRESPQTTTNFV